MVTTKSGDSPARGSATVNVGKQWFSALSTESMASVPELLFFLSSKFCTLDSKAWLRRVGQRGYTREPPMGATLLFAANCGG